MSASDWNCKRTFPLCVITAAFLGPTVAAELAFDECSDIISRLFVFADIEDLPPAVQEKLFDEVLDRDVQKGTHDLRHYISTRTG